MKITIDVEVTDSAGDLYNYVPVEGTWYISDPVVSMQTVSQFVADYCAWLTGYDIISDEFDVILYHIDGRAITCDGITEGTFLVRRT